MDTTLKVESMTQKANNPDSFASLAKQAWEKTNRPLVIRSSNMAALKAAAEAII